MSKEELEKRRADEKCYHCGIRGHIVWSCKLLLAKRLVNFIAARQAIKINEREDFDSLLKSRKE